MEQISMAGNDWLSERDRRQQARAEAQRRKTAKAAAAKLFAAAEALTEFSMACMECNDSSSPTRADDSRALLRSDMLEYAAYLDGVYS